MKTISDLLLPLLILLLLLAAGWKGLDALEGFIRGARQGMEVAVQVLPNLAGMLCAIALMRNRACWGFCAMSALRPLSCWACPLRWLRWCWCGPSAGRPRWGCWKLCWSASARTAPWA